MPSKASSPTHDCGLAHQSPTPAPVPTPAPPSGTVWRFRFSPDVEGSWTWTSHCPEDPGLDGKSGSVNVVASSNHGGIVVHPQYLHQFAREDGSVKGIWEAETT